MLAEKQQQHLVAVPVLRRGSTDCDAELSFGDCAGADLPLVKIVAALVGPSAHGWLTSRATNMKAHGSSLGRQRCATIRGRSNTTISFVEASAVARGSTCSPRAANALQGGLMLSNMPLQLTRADHRFGRRSTSRGRAAFQMNEGRRAAPAVVLSTIT